MSLFKKPGKVSIQSISILNFIKIGQSISVLNYIRNCVSLNVGTYLNILTFEY